MNAPLRHPSVIKESLIPDRFPRLSPAQKILQAAADRAIWRQIIAEMNLKPGISISSAEPDYPRSAWEVRNVLR
jgi:hypothetical protein